MPVPTAIVETDLNLPRTIDGRLMIRSGLTVQEMEKTLILETLRSTQNNRTEAAKLLGISIRTLRNKLHDYRQDGDVIEG
jgi:DNA-binding NtrC family response regulator